MPADMNDITLYHNPQCSTSRKALAMIRDSGAEPVVIEYLKTPPDRDTLLSLVQRMGGGVRDLLRAKAPAYSELGLADPKWTAGLHWSASRFDRAPHRCKPFGCARVSSFGEAVGGFAQAGR
jgi:arsenate reductase (glutaredoxin)